MNQRVGGFHLGQTAYISLESLLRFDSLKENKRLNIKERNGTSYSGRSNVGKRAFVDLFLLKAI